LRVGNHPHNFSLKKPAFNRKKAENQKISALFLFFGPTAILPKSLIISRFLKIVVLISEYLTKK
jgi:hypothetical protein